MSSTKQNKSQIKIDERKSKTHAIALFFHYIFSRSHLIVAAAMFDVLLYCKRGHSSITLPQNDKWY